MGSVRGERIGVMVMGEWVEVLKIVVDGVPVWRWIYFPSPETPSCPESSHLPPPRNSKFRDRVKEPR